MVNDSQGAFDLSSLVPSAQDSTSIAVPALVLEATDATFAPLVELSRQVPVIVHFWSQQSADHETLSTDLAAITDELAGKVVLVNVEAEPNTQLVQAFTVESVPAVLAVLAGAPLPLFVGAYPRAEMRAIFDKVLEFAVSNNVTGSAHVVGGDASATAGAPGTTPTPGAAPATGAEVPVAKPIPPLHAEAYEAAEKGDYETAIALWKKALAQTPNDADAIAGLAQVNLLHRLQGKQLADIREAAAKEPESVSAQLDVADLDISGGHFDDAFDRLLNVFARSDADDKTLIRERLIELFDVVGAHDPSVKSARAKLTNLLY